MVNGYHRRHVGKMQHLRLVLTEIRNCMRTEGELIKPEDVMELPGDKLTPAQPEMSEEEYLAAFSALAALDSDLL